MCRRVAAALAPEHAERALVVDRRLRPAELAGLLGRCERVLAMRFHAALFALAAGVPAAALAYDPKVFSLLAEAGLGGLALPSALWQAEEIAAALGQAAVPDLRDRLAGFAEEQRRRAGLAADLALEALDAGPPSRSEAGGFLAQATISKVLAVLGLEAEREALRRREAGLQAELRDARQDLLAERSTVERSRKERAESDAQLHARLQALDRERTALREQRDLILAERSDLDRRLTALERTLAYRLVSRFWRLMRGLFPEGSGRRKLYRLGRRAVGRLLGAGDPAGPEASWQAGAGGAPSTAAAAVADAPDPRAELLHFEERARAAGASRAVAIFSGTQLVESEGQRPTQLALALARRGAAVVFVYWRWWDHEWCPQDRLEEGIVQIPIDVVTRRPEMLAGAFEGLERIALFEFPHPGFLETLAAANSAGWITVYDVLDDWEEFHRVGQAIWYDEEFERHLTGACDAVFAINEFLAARVRGLGGPGVGLLGNGLKPGIAEVREPRPLARGEVTVGYFGYLAGAWFDWELIAESARRRPAWRFYLIGYGGSPEGSRPPRQHRAPGQAAAGRPRRLRRQLGRGRHPLQARPPGRGGRSDQDLRVPRHGAAGGGDRRPSAGGSGGPGRPRRGGGGFPPRRRERRLPPGCRGDRRPPRLRRRPHLGPPGWSRSSPPSPGTASGWPRSAPCSASPRGSRREGPVRLQVPDPGRRRGRPARPPRRPGERPASRPTPGSSTTTAAGRSSAAGRIASTSDPSRSASASPAGSASTSSPRSTPRRSFPASPDPPKGRDCRG